MPHTEINLTGQRRGETRTLTLATGSWLDYQHFDYAEHVGRWLYAKDHYNGEILLAERIKDYLQRRSLGESNEAYEERCRLADYTNHFGAVVDSIAGMLFAVEGSANRVFNKVARRDGRESVTTVLGDIADPNSRIGRLYVDADGNGTGWLTLWKLLAIELLVTHRGWVLVDPADGDPFVKLYPPRAVVNWRYDGEGLSDVVVREVADARTSIMDQPQLEEHYLHLFRGGWQRYKKDANGQPERMTGANDSGDYAFVDRRGNDTLPIFMVELPLRRMVGWQLAVKANRIFNQTSARDHLLRVANFPKLNLIGNDDLFDKLVEDLKRGANALQVDPNVSGGKAHHFIAPDSGPANISSKVLERKVEEFYVSAFRMYEDSAKEKTATEARQDVSAGVGAFLQLLKAAIDDAENQALWRIEQVYYPNDRSRWFTSKVERSEDFLPVDVDRAIEKLRDRYFGSGNTVPVGRTAMIQAVKQMLGWDGVMFSEAELEAAVDSRIFADAADSLRGLVDLPPEAKVWAVIRSLISSGFLPGDAEVQLADGGRQRLVDLVEQQVREGALAEAEARRRESESFPG